MSAAVENFKKGWLITVFATITSITAVVVTNAMSNSAEKEKERDERINQKADITWVNQRIEEVKTLSAKDVDYIKTTLGVINARTERLETLKMQGK